MGEDLQSTVSEHYGGEGAAEYFAYQQTDVKRNNWVSLRFFAPHIKPTDTVVDYGCGTGLLLDQLTAGEKLGFEPNANARAFADSIGIKTVSEASEIADGFADVVISNHALEHSLAPIEELRQIRRIVKPEGTVVICLPVDDWRAQRKLNPDDSDHHLHTWTPQLFANLLGEAGLEVTEIRAFSYLQSPPGWHLDGLPRPLFDFVAKLYGIKHRYHQLLAVARPAS